MARDIILRAVAIVERHILVKWADRVRMEWGTGHSTLLHRDFEQQGEMDRHGGLDMDARIQVAAVACDGERVG